MTIISLKRSLKEKLFKVVGHKFGIEGKVILNWLKKEEVRVGTMRMTPSQFLFISSDGKKVYGGLPKDLTKKILYYDDKKIDFYPQVDYAFKDGETLLMNVACWHGNRFLPPSPNYTNIIVKVENEKMFFAKYIRYSTNNHDIKKLTKDILHYDEKIFFGDYLQLCVRSYNLSNDFL